jgi:excisionase family DNA binding protein
VSELTKVSIETLLDCLAERIAAELAPRLASEQNHRSGDSRSPWMGIEKAATYLDWPKQRLYKLCASGAIPHYKQEGRLLFHRGELGAWLAQFGEGERSWLRRPRES